MGRTPLLFYVSDAAGSEKSARDYYRPRQMGHAPPDLEPRVYHAFLGFIHTFYIPVCNEGSASLHYTQPKLYILSVQATSHTSSQPQVQAVA